MKFLNKMLAYLLSVCPMVGFAQDGKIYAPPATINTEPSTILTDHFCGNVVNSWDELITANPIAGATAYKFNVIDAATGLAEEIITSEPSFKLRQLTMILVPHNQLNISVAVKTGSDWQPYGRACKINPTFVEVPCGFDPLREHWENVPGNAEVLQEQLAAIRQYIDTANLNDRSYIYTIPVVFHIIDDGTLVSTDPNFITNTEVDNQLAILNAAFENLMLSSNPNAANVQIRFCRAKQIYNTGPSASTNWTPYWTGYTGGEAVATGWGITRKTNAITNTHESNPNPSDPDGMVSLNTVIGSLLFPYERYLNIWIVNSITDPVNGDNVLGYSPYPLGSMSSLLTPAQQGLLDGVVIQTSTFLGGTHPTANTGKTLVHEVGHYLNLYHVWTDGCHPAGNCAVQGDFMCDTPTQSSIFFNACTTPVNSCDVTEADPTDNHMSYSGEACRITFTQDQKEWMHAAINLYRGVLVSNDNLSKTAPDCINPLLLANIVATNSTQICDGLSVPFTTSPVVGGGATYSWSFPGGTPSTSTSTIPSVTYSTPGVYSVYLTITQGATSVNMNRPNFVYVGDCSPGSLKSNDGNWYYGLEAGLAFLNGMGENTSFTGGVTPTPNNIQTIEAASSLSDDNGNLIFYTDGNTVYNRLHQVMAGHVFGAIDGNHYNVPMMGSPNGYGSSSHNGAIVFEDPNNVTTGPAIKKYYAFHTSQAQNAPPAGTPGINNGLGYSLVAEGTGYAVNGQVLSVNNRPTKNYAIAECVQAVSHCNGRDYWVLVQGTSENAAVMTTNPGFLFSTQNQYYFSYLVSPTGLTTAEPVANLSASQPNLSALTTFKFSPDGNMVACLSRNTGGTQNYWDVLFYAFDRSNGQMSYLATFDIPLTSNKFFDYHDLEFSPDGKVLYVTIKSALLQIDISDVYNSPTSFNYSSKSSSLDQMQLGPDGRIYCTNGSGTIAVSVINFPNELNTSSWSNECGLNEYGLVYDSPSKQNRSGIQNSACIIDNTAGGFIAHQQHCLDFEFIPNICGRRYLWDFDGLGTSTEYMPTFTFPGSGTYTIGVTVDGITTYQNLIIEVPQVEITGNPFFCNSPEPVDFFATMNPPVGDYAYSWTTTGGLPATSTNSFISFVLTGSSGVISVTVTDLATGCTTTDNITVTKDCCPSGVMADHPFKLNHTDGRTEGYDVALSPSQGLIYYGGNYTGDWTLGTYSVPVSPFIDKGNFIIQLSDDNCVGWIENYPVFVSTGTLPSGTPSYMRTVRPIKVKTTSTGRVFMASQVYGHSYIAEIDAITGTETILFELFDNVSNAYQGNIISDFIIDEVTNEIVFSATINATSFAFPGVPLAPSSRVFVGRINYNTGLPVNGYYYTDPYITSASATKGIVQNNSGGYYLAIQSGLTNFRVYSLSNTFVFGSLVESYIAATQIELTDFEYDATNNEMALIGNLQGNISAPLTVSASGAHGFLAYKNLGTMASQITVLTDQYSGGFPGLELVSGDVYYQSAEVSNADLLFGLWTPGSPVSTLNSAISTSSSIRAGAIDFDPVQGVFYANGHFWPDLDFGGIVLSAGISAGLTFYAAKIDFSTGGFLAIGLSDVGQTSNQTFTELEPGFTTTDMYVENPLFEIYPNPTNGTFNLVLTDQTVASANVTIRDLRGAIIFNGELTQQDGPLVFDSNQLQMSPGMYTISLITDASEIHKKLIVH